jgi:hypothetical protein
MIVSIHRASDGYRWRAQTPYGEVVSESVEAYAEKGDAVASAKKSGPTNAVIFTDDQVTDSGDSGWDNFRQ